MRLPPYRLFRCFSADLLYDRNRFGKFHSDRAGLRRENEERMKAIVGTTLTFTFMLGVVLAVVGSVFTLDILRLMGTPENVIDVSVRYARILFCAMPLMFYILRIRHFYAERRFKDSVLYVNRQYSHKHRAFALIDSRAFRTSEVRHLRFGVCNRDFKHRDIYRTHGLFTEKKTSIGI